MTLGELADFVMGQAPPGEACNKEGVGTPFVKAGEFGDVAPIIREWTTKPLQLAQRNDVLVCVVGATSGKVNLGADCAIGRSVAAVRPRPGLLDQRFAFHFLRTQTRRLRSGSQGSAQGVITRAMLGSLTVPPIPLDEQRKIADMLDKADAIRRKRKEAIALTEELLRSAFLEMVGPGARNYVAWSVRTIESLAAQIPNAIRTGPFGSDLRHSEFVDEGIVVLGIDNAVKNRFAWGERRYITQNKYEKLRRYTVHPEDVIVTIMGTTGRSAVVPDNIPTAITTKHLAAITLDREQTEPEFVSQAFYWHPEVLRQIAAANRGAIMNGLNLGLIKALRIPLPPIDQQRKFAELTRRARALTARMSSDDATDDLFNALVTRAFPRMLKAAC